VSFVAPFPVIPLARAYGQARIETGLVVMRHQANRLPAPGADEWSELDWLRSVAFHHEWVHYLQAITCSSVHYLAQRLLTLSSEILHAGPETPDELRDEFRAVDEELYGRRWDGHGAPVRIHDEPGITIVEPVGLPPETDQLSLLDLIEGVAVLESFKLTTSGGTHEDFLRFRDEVFPGGLRSPYRLSFNWVATDIGPAAAYDLLSPVTYVSLHTRDPQKTFGRLSERLADGGDVRAAVEPDALWELLGVGPQPTWLAAFEAGEPDGGHVTLDPGITAAVAAFGSDELARIGAEPSRVTREQAELLRPPLTAFGGEDRIWFERAPHTDDTLAARVLAWTGWVGAAERLTLAAGADPYQFCPHGDACPHHFSALCHRHFAPPPPSADWADCGFIATMRRELGVEPAALWDATGRGAKTPAELVEVFEDTGEGKLAAVCQQQRASLVRWLGPEAYEDLLNQCEMVGDQALRAMSGDLQELAMAQMMRGAVIDQVRRRSAQLDAEDLPG
jgi:hypothetical protein